MKVTQIAAGAIFLLVLAAGFLMVDSANDKKFALMQDKLNEMSKKIDQTKQAPSPPPAPEVEPVVAEVPKVAKSAPVAPKTAPAPVAEIAIGAPPEPEITLPSPEDPLTLAPGEKALLLEAATKQDGSLATARSYNPLQVKIKNLPTVAKVKSFNADYGFVELDAGKNRALEKDMAFEIRRDAMIVGKVKITDSVEDAGCIADVDPKSVPAGVVLQPGDEIVRLN
jgi:hypothetical protein